MSARKLTRAAFGIVTDGKGWFYARIDRRCHDEGYVAKPFRSLPEAVKWRAETAKTLPKRKPQPKFKYHDGLTTRQRRRRAGLCDCGAKPERKGLLTCDSCIEVASAKGKARKERG